MLSSVDGPSSASANVSASAVQRTEAKTFDLRVTHEDLLARVHAALAEHNGRLVLANATAPGADAAPGSDTLEAATTRATSACTMLRSCADHFPSLRGVFTTAASDTALLVQAAQNLADEQARLHAAAVKFEDDFKKRVEEAREVQFSELAAMQRALAARDSEGADLLRTIERLRREADSLRQEASTENSRTDELAEQVRELRIDVAVKRDALGTAQNKVNTVVQENLFLRKICAHNESLLQEIDELKQSLGDREVAYRELQQQRSAQGADAQREKEGLVRQAAKMKAVLDQQAEEIVLLRRAVYEASSVAGECRRQRDEAVGASTPRPSIQPVLAALGLSAVADNGVGPSGRFRTAELTRQLVAKCNELQSHQRILKNSLEAQCKLTGVLDVDDYEAMHQRGSNFPPSVPVTSRTLLAHGRVVTVPPHLRFEGLVLVRSVSLMEIVVLFNEFRAWVRRGWTQDPTLASDDAAAFQRLAAGDMSSGGTPNEAGTSPAGALLAGAAATGIPHCQASYAFAGFLWNRFGPDVDGNGSAQRVADAAYTYHAAMQQWRFSSPQAEIFALTLEGRCDLGFYDSAVGKVKWLLSAIRTAVKSSNAEQGTGGNAAAQKKRVVVKRRAFFDAIQVAWPTLTDGDHLRLRALANVELDKIGDGREDVAFEVLLEEAQGGVLMPFAAALLRLETINAQSFALDVIRGIHGHALVTRQSLVTAISRADPERSTADCRCLADEVLQHATAAATGETSASEESAPLADTVAAVQLKCNARVAKRPVAASMQNDAATATMDPRKIEDLSRRAVLALRKSGGLAVSASQSFLEASRVAGPPT